MDKPDTELFPGNMGNDCPGNGERYENGVRLECECDECDYLKCCIDETYPARCGACPEPDCPRKRLNGGV